MHDVVSDRWCTMSPIVYEELSLTLIFGTTLIHIVNSEIAGNKLIFHKENVSVPRLGRDVLFV